MNLDPGLLRATEEAVDALARLDEQVLSSAPGMATILMLRSAQAIVAQNDRPASPIPAGETAFAALLGWWYARHAREFIVDDPTLRGIALALDAAARQVRSRRTLTPGLLDDAMRDAGLAMPMLPDALDAVLRDADEGYWPALLLASGLASGACGRVRSMPASIARSVALLTGSVLADAFVVPTCADDASGAMHAVADEARHVRRRVAAYREDCANAAACCHDLGRGSASALALLELLAGTPAVTVSTVASALGVTAPTAGAAVDRLMERGLVREITGRGRDRVFVYAPTIALAD